MDLSPRRYGVATSLDAVSLSRASDSSCASPNAAAERPDCSSPTGSQRSRARSCANASRPHGRLFHHAKHSDSLWLYPVDPEAPAETKLLSPHELAGWLVTAADLKLIVWNRFKPAIRSRDQARISRAGRCAGRGTLSPRARGTSADRERPGRDLSQEPAR